MNKLFRSRYRRAGLPVSIPILLVLAVVLIVVCSRWQILSLPRSPVSMVVDLTYSVAVSFVVSCMFYYLTVSIKYYRDLPKRKRYISIRLNAIIHASEFVLTELETSCRAAGIKFDDAPTIEELQNACAVISPNTKFATKPEGAGDDFDWFDAINMVFDVIHESKQEILIVSPDIDMDLLALLDGLTDSQINRFSLLPSGRRITNLSGWNFAAFFHIIKKLREYRDCLDKDIKKRHALN